MEDDSNPLRVSTEELKKILYEWNNIRKFKKSKSKIYDILMAELEAGNTIRETYRGRFSDSDNTTFIFLNDVLKTMVRTDMRTPGYCSWQGEYWLACCDDYCEYLGDVGYEELKEMNLEYLIEEYKKQREWTLKMNGWKKEVPWMDIYSDAFIVGNIN